MENLCSHLVCRKVPRSQSYQDVNGTMDPRLLLEEKEQALLASQETVQVRRIVRLLTIYLPRVRS